MVKPGHLKPCTLHRYRRTHVLHLSSAFADMPFTDLRAIDIEDWMVEQRDLAVIGQEHPKPARPCRVPPSAAVADARNRQDQFGENRFDCGARRRAARLRRAASQGRTRRCVADVWTSRPGWATGLPGRRAAASGAGAAATSSPRSVAGIPAAEQIGVAANEHGSDGRSVAHATPIETSLHAP